VADPPARRIRVQRLILYISMKHFLMISALVVFGCCFGVALQAQAPACKPSPECKKVCTPSSAASTGDASVAVVPASMSTKACSGQATKPAASAHTTGYLVSNTQTQGAGAKANCAPANSELSKCDPAKCDLSKCLPPGCDPSKCDLSKCLPAGNGASGKASKVQRL